MSTHTHACAHTHPYIHVHMCTQSIFSLVAVAYLNHQNTMFEFSCVVSFPLTSNQLFRTDSCCCPSGSDDTIPYSLNLSDCDKKILSTCHKLSISRDTRYTHQQIHWPYAILYIHMCMYVHIYISRSSSKAWKSKIFRKETPKSESPYSLSTQMKKSQQ